MHATHHIAEANAAVPFACTAQERRLILRAIETLERHLFQTQEAIARPEDLADYFRLHLAGQRREVFVAVFLDTKHRILAYESLFFGTIHSATVSPRVIIERALAHNCAAVIFAHNHPSGCVDASGADRSLTRQLTTLLQEIDVRVLDHFIIGQGEPLSFSKHGLL